MMTGVGKVSYRSAAASQGSVFLLAMVALVALLLLGASLVQSAVQGLAWASDGRKQADAFSLAESGVDMAITKLYEDYDDINATLASTGTYADSYTLTQGTVSYTVTAPYSGITDTCLIVSDSTTNAGEGAQVRVIAAYQRNVGRVFEGAIFSNSPLTLNGVGGVWPNADGEGGDIYANGDIDFSGTSFQMDPAGEMFSTGTINWVPDGVPATHVHENVAPVSMPVIDIDYYKSIATTTYNGNTTFNDSNLAGVDGVIFVKGNVNISGSYTGKACIVATGKVQITGDVTASNPDEDTLVIMSPKSVRIAGNCHIDGLVYAHSVIESADTTIGGNVSITGAIIADVVTTNGGITVTYSDVWKDLALPGTGKTQWAPVSWQHLPR
jgi:cytoskeletal protein CcmA (bactofilin family)